LEKKGLIDHEVDPAEATASQVSGEAARAIAVVEAVDTEFFSELPPPDAVDFPRSPSAPAGAQCQELARPVALQTRVREQTGAALRFRLWLEPARRNSRSTLEGLPS
jgi:hypothetical protein